MARSASIELGPYQLLERIAEGGSGQIYRARGPAGPVAVKVLGPAAELDDAARARFEREIAALGQLSHPNLVRLVDHGIDAELGPYLVLPLLAGTTLRALAGGTSVCPEAALLYATPLAAATAALHAAGFVHRDLKPENAIAAPDGTITVIDLGLAWRDGMTRHTDTGAAVGSVGYMAPEQVEGRTVDARADVWALGVMIYEWIAGKRPFARARPAEEAAAVLLGQCPRLTAADRRAGEDLAELVASCLALDPGKRPTAAALSTALEAMIDWTDEAATERAAAVADPAGYQARIAPFRVRRVERVAREALDAGKPFAAVAACDRGLAYAPDHPALLELVATAEAATAGRAAAAAPAPASDAPSAPLAAPAVAAPTVTAPARRPRRWPWLAVGAGGIAVGALLVYLVVPEHHAPRDPWADPGPSATAPARPVQVNVMSDQDRAIAKAAITLFGQALTTVQHKTPEPPAGTPTTATGWLELAATQEPAEAVVSVRHALALSPTWIDAQMALCVTLAAAHDDGAVGACDIALRQRPNEVTLLAARGAAKVRAGQAKAALPDLDRVIAADPDPKWRRLRAEARTAAGDRAGARRDLEAACQLGDTASCHDP